MTNQFEKSPRKILVLTTISRTINAFLIPHIIDMVNNGYLVEIACNNINQIDNCIKRLNLITYELPLSRNPFSLKNLIAMKRLNSILKTNQYYIIHTHTPIISVLVRFLGIKHNLDNIYYTAHGFHFFKGAPLKNWILFYPIEKYLSRYTNTLVTINKEDFELANRKFSARRVVYIPGIGVDLTKYNDNKYIEKNICDLPEINSDNLNIFSVGEINKNKNHIVILRALNELNNNRIHYYIVGEGKNKTYLKKIIKKYKLSERVHFLGFRNDVPSLLKFADLFAFPSKREGLGLAAIEAIASNVPLLTSNIHGINDYSIVYQTAFKCNPNDYKCFAQHIFNYLNDRSLKKNLIAWKEKNIGKYSIVNILSIMQEIYRDNDNKLTIKRKRHDRNSICFKS